MGASRGRRRTWRELIPTRFAPARKPTSPFQGEVQRGQSSFTLASRSALPMTLTEDSAIAAAAMIGDSKMPNTG